MAIKQVKKLNKFNIPNNAINIYGNHPAKSALLSSNRSCYLLCTTEKKFDYWKNFVICNKINIKIVVLETFELYGCYVESANYNTLNYAESTPVTVQLAIRYDNAIQTPQGTGLGTAIGRTVNTAITGGGNG